jgi:23S rRNA pseudouridine1911/1915/1917 synthase
MLDILYKNNQFLAVNKPAGTPVQADKTGDQALQQLAEAYCHHTLHLVNRLDRPVSGITLFAKTKTAMAHVQAQFGQRTVDKLYLAVVQEAPAEPEGVLKHFLKKNTVKNTVLALDEAQPGTEPAELHYRLLGSSERYHLLQVRLVTGRHHQIRAQLAAIGCIIKGDVKYGARRGNTDRSIHLHAWQLAFNHPVSGERETLTAPPPADDPVWQAFRSALEG